MKDVSRDKEAVIDTRTGTTKIITHAPEVSEIWKLYKQSSSEHLFNENE